MPMATTKEIDPRHFDPKGEHICHLDLSMQVNCLRRLGTLANGVYAWILAINAVLESERGGVGVLPIAAALAFRLDGGLLGSWDRG
jgi:hypothetical protein